MGVVENSIVRDGDAWMSLYPADIPAHMWYRMPLWINPEMEPTIMSSRIYLEQARDG